MHLDRRAPGQALIGRARDQEIEISADRPAQRIVGPPDGEQFARSRGDRLRREVAAGILPGVRVQERDRRPRAPVIGRARGHDVRVGSDRPEDFPNREPLSRSRSGEAGVHVGQRVALGVGTHDTGRAPGQAVVGRAGDHDVEIRADGIAERIARNPDGEPGSRSVGRHLGVEVVSRIGGGVGVERPGRAPAHAVVIGSRKQDIEVRADRSPQGIGRLPCNDPVARAVGGQAGIDGSGLKGEERRRTKNEQERIKGEDSPGPSLPGFSFLRHPSPLSPTARWRWTTRPEVFSSSSRWFKSCHGRSTLSW